MKPLRDFLATNGEVLFEALELVTCGFYVQRFASTSDHDDRQDRSAGDVLFSRRLFTSLGWPEPALSELDQVWSRLIDANDQAAVRRLRTAGLDSHRGSEPMVIQYNMVRADGRRRQTEETGRIVTLHSGEQVWLSVLVDIDQPSAVKRELERRHRDMQVILDTIPTCIWFKDQNERILRCNKAAAELSGLTVDQIEGKLTGEVYPRAAQRFAQSDRAAIKNGSVSRVMEALPLPDGSSRQMTIDKYLVRTDGEFLNTPEQADRILVVGTDITESERISWRLRLASEFGQVGFWEWDPIRDKVSVTDEFLAQLGLTEPWTSLKDFNDCVHPDDIEAASARVRNFLSNQTDAYESLVRLRHADGSYRWMLSRGAKVFAPDGELDRLVGFHIDVTEQQETRLKLQANQIELQRSNEDLNRFAYVASHDLKAPLRRLKHLCEWIEQDATDRLGEEVESHIEKMNHQLNRMNLLLDDLLAYSRIGRHQKIVEDVDLNITVSELFEFMSPPDSVKLIIEKTLPTIRTCRAPLEQTLRNLIGNAILHGGSGGEVRVSCRVLDEQLVFCIADRGPGIAPEFHERIFELFESLRPTGDGMSTGMGLSLVHRLAESQGGSAWVESSPGDGARFFFSWPLTPPSD